LIFFQINHFSGTIVVSDDGKYVHIFPDAGSMMAWFYAPLKGNAVNSSLKFIPVIEQPVATFQFITSDDNIVYLITNKNAPNCRLVKVDLNKPQEVS
jgi:hypothetical protein